MMEADADRRASRGETERQLVYLVDAQSSLATQQLVVQIAQRERKIDELLKHPMHGAVWGTKFSDITVRKHTDKSSPSLMVAACTRKHFPKGQIDFVRPPGGGGDGDDDGSNGNPEAQPPNSAGDGSGAGDLSDGNAPGIPPLTGEIIATGSGLRYIHEMTGTGAMPTPSQCVTVHYTEEGDTRTAKKVEVHAEEEQPAAPQQTSLASGSAPRPAGRTEVADASPAAGGGPVVNATDGGGLAAGEIDPSAIILDLALPGMDGWEILRRLREHPTLNSVPVLLVTGQGGEANVVRGFQMGADDYLTKPFSVAELRARVRRQIHRRHGTTPPTGGGL